MTEIKKSRSNTPENKSKTPMFLLGVLSIAAILFVLQFFGIFKTIDTKRTNSAIDIHSPEYQNQKMAQRRPEKPSAAVESTINEIAQEINGPVFSDIRTANTQRGWGLSDDQARYYDLLKTKINHKNTNWLSETRNAFQLYNTVKSVISPDGTPVSQILNEPPRLQALMQGLQQSFNIPAKETFSFASQNKPQNISDWTLFVKEHQ